MERIVYRKTLDAHKNGIQFTLQGFETADNMARTIELSLMASGDAIDLPLEQLSAIMYVTTPNSTEPSINECSIKDNTIIYDVLPITEEGITEMQLKLIETRPDGAKGVLMSPKFAVEVTNSNAEDESVTQSTTYTALENAIASAKAVYDSRMLRVEIDTDCMFRVVYADGTVYETDVLNETLLKGEAVLSQSYARGDTGTRTGEDTDNSLYYSNVSKSASEDAQRVNNEAIELLDETRKHGVYTAFSIDFETGEVKYISPAYKFNINKENGNLEAIGQTYTPEETIELVVTEWLEKMSASLNFRMDNVESALGNANNTLQDLSATVDTNYRNLDKAIDELDTTMSQALTDAFFQINALETTATDLSERLTDVENNYFVKTSTVGERIDNPSSTVIMEWTYEKKASGAAKCWGNLPVTIRKVTKLDDYHFYCGIGNVWTPNNLFIEAPVVNCDIGNDANEQAALGPGAFFLQKGCPTKDRTGMIYACATSLNTDMMTETTLADGTKEYAFASPIQAIVSIEAKGKWK